MKRGTRWGTHVLLLCLLGLLNVSVGRTGEEPTPQWSYEYAAEENALRITVSTAALRTDELMTEGRCRFSIDSDSRTFELSMPIEAKTTKTQKFTEGLESASDVVGIEMQWTVDYLGVVMAQSRGKRNGSSPPSS